MNAAAIGVAQKAKREPGIDEQASVDRVVLVLAALTRGLCRRVLGADEAPLGAVRGTRGEAGGATGAATTGAGSSHEPTTAAASASETPSRWARAVRERAGAAPRARSAASSTGSRT